MSSEPSAGSRGGGLQTAIDMLVAPRDAFARLRENPTWGWAYLIAAALAVVGTLAILPALRHAMEVGLPAQIAASPQIAKLPPDQQQAQIARVLAIQQSILNVSWLAAIVILPVVTLVQTAVMFVANKLGGGDAPFRRLWALALNVQVAGSVGGLIAAAIVLLRGTNSFDDPSHVQTVIPSLGLLVPSAPHAVAAFLSALNVVAIWQTVLLGFGMIAVARIGRPAAWTAALVMLLSLGVFATIGAIAQPHSG